jgi:hypothetical protein
MGYFISILRERIANFEAPQRAITTETAPMEGNMVASVSINDLRKNLRDLNELMDRECLLGSGALRHSIRRLADHQH